MKQLYPIVLGLIIIFSSPAMAQFTTEDIEADWTFVGSAGFSTIDANRTDIEVASNGTIYVAIGDNIMNNDLIEVWRHEGGNWSMLGSSFSGEYNRMAFTLGPNDEPYLLLEDGSLDLYKWENNQWNNVGATVNSNGGGSVDVAVSSTGTPYCVFRIASDIALVRRFGSGQFWELVGGGFFHEGVCFSNKMIIGPDDYPTIIYTTGPDEDSLSSHVAHFNGSSWVDLGPNDGRIDPGILTNFSFHDIAYDSNGDLYAVISEGNNLQYMNAYRFDGTNWVKFSSNIGNGETDYLDLEVTSLDYLVVSFREESDKQSVMIYRDGAWGYVGPAGFSSDDANNQSLSIGPEDIPYIAFADEGISNQLTVMQNVTLDNTGIFDFPVNNLDLSVSPNPNQGSFNLQVEGLIQAEYQVVDMLGKTVYRGLIHNPSAGVYEQRIDLPQGVNPGLYFLNVQNEEKAGTVKLMIY